MKLSMGIVGLPNVGKSTLFNALTKKSVPAENYPFCTIDPSVGIVAVPDERLHQLADFSKTLRTIPAAMEFVDIAGLVEGASKGEGLGNKFLSNIREVDAILHMVRLFALVDNSGNTVNHVYGTIDPLRDIKIISMELILADMDTVTNRLNKITRDAKRGDKEAVLEHDLLTRVLTALEAEKLANTIEVAEKEAGIYKSLHLLTAKPVLYALNSSNQAENIQDTDPEKYAELLSWIKETGSEYVLLDAATEHDLKDFEGEEKDEFRVELGAKHDGIDHLIKQSYVLLGLMSYFTTGVQETRAWTVPVGATAPQAGAAIHGDFEQKFIRAEVINWELLIEAGSHVEARARGELKTVGRDYIVQDGDVIEFKI
ncbi:MAG: GTP-binding protein YchF [Planctomycetota bacterium]|jgi:GTP-binding protein YchF